MSGSLRRIFSRHGLAIACVVAPLVFGLWGGYLAVAAIMHAGHVDAIKLDYRFRDQLLPNVVPASPPTAVSAERDAERLAAERATARMDLVARHFSGIVNLAVSSSVLYFIACVAFAAGAFHVARHAGRKVVVLVALLCLAIAAAQAFMMVQGDHRRVLVTGNILRLAETHEALKDLPMVSAVKTVLGVNIAVGLTAVFMLFASLYIATIRPEKPDLAGLKERLFVVRAVMVLASILLVIVVLFTRALVDWPLSLLTEAQKIALGPAAEALARVWGASASIALVASIAPAIVSWHLDREIYRGAHSEAGATADGLEIAPMSTATSLLAVLAPVVASPMLDAFKSLLGAVSGR